MHTAGWKADVDIRGKRVALIGTGASAGQLGPAITDKVEHLTVFQRSKHWVLFNPHYTAKVSKGDKWALKHIPYFAEWFRFRAYWFASDGLYANVTIDPEWPHQDISVSAQNDAVRQYCLSHLSRELEGRPDLIAKLTPDFPVFSKRIVLDGGWLAMMKRNNVSPDRIYLGQWHRDARWSRDSCGYHCFRHRLQCCQDDRKFVCHRERRPKSGRGVG
jgi:4-hydroxyacetophenone monooxygenase